MVSLPEALTSGTAVSRLPDELHILEEGSATSAW
jgi:hypothetical protein